MQGLAALDTMAGDCQHDSMTNVLPRPDYKTLTERQLGKLKPWHTVEPKMDGIWCEVQIADGVAIGYSRTGQEKARWSVPADIVATLHGELLVGSTWAKERGISGQLHLFECTQLHGVDVTGAAHSHRRELAVAVVAQVDGWQMVPCWSGPEALAVWADLVVAQDYEGLVVKDSRAKWGVGWSRCKAQVDWDFVCLGWEYAKGPYSDHPDRMLPVSMICGLYVDGVLKPVGKVFGLAQEAAKIRERPELYRGKVFTAIGQRRFASGALRHGVFCGWHKDKPAKACVL